MSAETITIIAAAVVALTATIVLPIFITRKRLKSEWERYNDSKRRYEEMQAAGVIDPDTMLPRTPAEEESSDG